MKLHPNIKYRSDIDGLRAFAVLSVILFHINSHWIPGGFLGVDIFFVISGYLITLILTKEIDETNKINISNFYKRRIKRIIPALLFVLIPTFIIGFLIFTPNDLLALSKSMIWAFFSAANIYFYSSIDTGYFAAGSSELPLLHLWSLGVEEQFYILWPFAVLLLLTYINSIQKRILLASILFIGSLIWAQSIIVTDHSFAYYLLPTRAWELLGGAITALLVHSGIRPKGLVSELMASIGLIAIILSFIFVSESDPVPGLAALPVIIGSALLILSGTAYQTYTGRILSLKIFVAIGLVSYSAYLWHWPILAFLRYALIKIDIPVAIFVLFGTFIMATISYFLIETPLRKNDVNTKNVFLWYFIVPAILIGSISISIKYEIKHKKNWIFPWEKIDLVGSKTLAAYSYNYNCQYRLFDIKAYTEQRCVYPENTDKANVFLIGDSNAAHYLGMLRVIAKHYKFSIRNATQSACPMVFNENFNWISPSFKEGCAVYTSTLIKEVNKYDTVIVGGSWNVYFDREGFNTSFEKTIQYLSENVNHVILLPKIPTYNLYNNDCELKSIRIKSLKCVLRFNSKQPTRKENQFLKNIANKYPNVEYFDIRHILCNKGICSPYLEGEPVYYNAHHLSMKGSEFIGNKMILHNDPILHMFDYLKHTK